MFYDLTINKVLLWLEIKSKNKLAYMNEMERAGVIFSVGKHSPVARGKEYVESIKSKI